MIKKSLLIAAIVGLLILLSACGSAPVEAEPAEVGELKVALLPILDSLPYFVAEQNGYFAEEGVEVEPLVVVSAVDRNQLMQSGEIDGMLAELSTVATFNRDEIQLKAVITSRKAYPDAPLFRVLAAPGSDITSAADLAGVPVGIAENTIIEYVTDRLLESEGLSADQIVGESVPAIPERYQLLMEGQIAAATLPDPMGQSAIESGAVPVIDDSLYPEVAISVLAFSADTVENNPEGLRRFLRAWDRAAGDINAEPEAYRGLLLEQVSVPPNIQETYQIPPFPRAEIPTAEQWDDVIDWLIEKGLVESAVAYEDSVTGDYLP